MINPALKTQLTIYSDEPARKVLAEAMNQYSNRWMESRVSLTFARVKKRRSYSRKNGRSQEETKLSTKVYPLPA